MTNTTVRITKAGKHFEILVDLDAALKFKKGESSFIQNEADFIFTNLKKGDKASSSDLKDSFGTNDENEIVQKIVKGGEVLVSQEHRDEEQDKKFKQVVEFLVVNAIDPQTGNPHTAERLKGALQQAHVNVKNAPIEGQIKDIVSEISKIIPIKIETRKVKINIPAIHTGKAYGVINQYKSEENWLDDGSLEVIVDVPAGIIIDFYEKLNGVTHGSATTEDIRQDE